MRVGWYEATALTGALIGLGLGVLFAAPAVWAFVSFKKSAKGWKVVAGLVLAFLAIGNFATAIDPAQRYFDARRVSQLQAQSQTPTPTPTTDTSLVLIATTTTARASIYAVPTDATAAEWAENAISYAEDQNWRWDNRDDTVSILARYAKGRCRSLSLEPNGSTPTQVEAHLRDWVGFEGWEDFGPAWYGSLVNGLCIRPTTTTTSATSIFDVKLSAEEVQMYLLRGVALGSKDPGEVPESEYAFLPNYENREVWETVAVANLRWGPLGSSLEDAMYVDLLELIYDVCEEAHLSGDSVAWFRSLDRDRTKEVEEVVGLLQNPPGCKFPVRRHAIKPLLDYIGTP